MKPSVCFQHSPIYSEEAMFQNKLKGKQNIFQDIDIQAGLW